MEPSETVNNNQPVINNDEEGYLLHKLVNVNRVESEDEVQRERMPDIAKPEIDLERQTYLQKLLYCITHTS